MLLCLHVKLLLLILPSGAYGFAAVNEVQWLLSICAMSQNMHYHAEEEDEEVRGGAKADQASVADYTASGNKAVSTNSSLACKLMFVGHKSAY